MSNHLCPKIEHALSIISTKWNARIVQFLLHSPARFTQIEVGIGISAKMLCERLKQLEKEAIVIRNEASNQIIYALTEKGLGMQKIIDAIIEWSYTY